MAAEALAALATGWQYDRIKGRVLLILPILVTAVPSLAFAGAPAVAISGVLIWGTAVGIQDSTVKALVADLAPTPGAPPATASSPPSKAPPPSSAAPSPEPSTNAPHPP